MKKGIGWLRWNYCTELDYINSSASSLGTDLRVPIIDTFLRMGIEVTIYSLLSPRDLEIIRTGKGEKFDYSFFKNIKYCPGEKIKEDVVIVEQATGFSTATGVRNGKEEPFMGIVGDSLRDYKGTVYFYKHGNMSDKMYYLFMDVKKDDSLHKYNMKNLLYDMNISWDQIKIWNHMNNKDDFVSSSKYHTEENFHFSPIGFSKTFEPQRKFNPNAIYDFIYIGACKNERKEKLYNLLYDSKYSVLIIGKDWHESEFMTQDKNFNLFGQYKGHGNIADLYRLSKFSLIIGDDVFEKYGNETTRFTQSINFGNITFSDRKMTSAEKYVGKDFMIDSISDITKTLDKIKGEEDKYLHQQQSNLNEWKTLLPNVFKELEFSAYEESVPVEDNFNLKSFEQNFKKFDNDLF